MLVSTPTAKAIQRVRDVSSTERHPREVDHHEDQRGAEHAEGDRLRDGSGRERSRQLLVLHEEMTTRSGRSASNNRARP